MDVSVLQVQHHGGSHMLIRPSPNVTKARGPSHHVRSPLWILDWTAMEPPSCSQADGMTLCNMSLPESFEI